MDTKQDFFTRKKEESGIVLNAVQQEAVKQTEGPLLLLASPGPKNDDNYHADRLFN